MRIAWVVLLLAGIGVAVYLVLARGSEAPTPPAEPKAGGPMTEEQRRAYLAEFVKLRGLQVGPDLDPDGNEVPGLLRVEGSVENQGERTLRRLLVVVYPKDDSGDILGMEQQNVLEKGRLEPGEVREFRFQIGAQDRFSGELDSELR